ncbi:TPA: hypothetical protein JBI17_12845 [Legionella pneumophila]|nr:hypothetical protein [Legionella pneumophila]HAU2264210.1 hypothetical protein [Legionella pneumophila]
MIVVASLLLLGFLVYDAIRSSKNKNALDLEKIFKSSSNLCMQFIEMQIFHACTYHAYTLKQEWNGDVIWSIVRSITTDIYNEGLFTEFLPLYYFGITFAATERVNLNKSSASYMQLQLALMSKVYNAEQAAISMHSIITSQAQAPIGGKPTHTSSIIVIGHAQFDSFITYCSSKMNHTNVELLSLPATLLHYCIENDLNAKEAFAFYDFLLENHKDYLINKINFYL